MMRTILILGLLSWPAPFVAFQAVAAHAQRPATNASIDSLKFLLGKWVGEGTAETGQAGAGYCSFEMGLQDKIMVRKNHSEYPGTKEHPAIVHDDLMIIYPDHTRQQLRAFYTDNEGNVIHYTLTAASSGRSVLFPGDAEPGARRYRSTYTLTGAGYMTITFEMAPPDRPDQFQKFIEGRLHRSPEAN